MKLDYSKKHFNMNAKIYEGNKELKMKFAFTLRNIENFTLFRSSGCKLGNTT